MGKKERKQERVIERQRERERERERERARESEKERDIERRQRGREKEREHGRATYGGKIGVGGEGSIATAAVGVGRVREQQIWSIDTKKYIYM